MERKVFHLHSGLDRASALGAFEKALELAPDGSRVEFKGPTRNKDQNAYLWHLLNHFAEQYEAEDGRQTTAELLKFSFLRMLGKETRYAPDLDRGGYFPIGASSSDLSVGEMSDLIEMIKAYAAEQGIEIPPHPRYG